MEDFLFLCGFDEAGRGPLAGPVVAACAILPSDFPIEILGDSKALSEKKRNEAEKIIKEKACFGIGEVDHKTIDKINILASSLLAMKIAYEEMTKKIVAWAEKKGIALPENGFSDSLVFAITDGNFCPQIPCTCVAKPKADATYPPVMAASILAKVHRDNIMRDFDELYPGYGYAKHKGYPTASHVAAIKKLGPSPIQRLTFGSKKKKDDEPSLFDS